MDVSQVVLFSRATSSHITHKARTARAHHTHQLAQPRAHIVCVTHNMVKHGEHRPTFVVPTPLNFRRHAGLRALLLLILPLRALNIWLDDLADSFTKGSLHPSHWASAYSTSVSHANTQRLLRAARCGSANVTITLTGGSSSAKIKGFAYFLAQRMATALSEDATEEAECDFSSTWLCHVAKNRSRAASASPPQVIEVVPASQGHTGTDFAAVLMDALVPQRTDILLWEFVINDWQPHIGNRAFLPTALAIYVRRALAINPHMVIIFLHLWAPLARSCWPRCNGHKGQTFIWNACVNGMALYNDTLDLTQIDFNSIAVQHFIAGHGKVNESKLLFADKQHPNTLAHKLMGDVIWQHLRLLMPPPPAHDAAAEREGCSVRDGARRGGGAPILPLPPRLGNVSNAPDALPAGQLMWRLLSTPANVNSWTHSIPHHGGSQLISFGLTKSPQADNNVSTLETAIASAPTRSDSVVYARLPNCDDGQMWHSLKLPHSRRGSPPGFVGLNFVQYAGMGQGADTAASDLDRGELVITTSFSCSDRTALMRTEDLVPGNLRLADLVGEINASLPESPPGFYPDDQATGFAVLLRGIHAPQVWFRLRPPACAMAAAAPIGRDRRERNSLKDEQKEGPSQATGALSIRVQVCRKPASATAGMGAIVFA